ncbi:zinc finger protein 2 [Grosmannia clavigera kw1407]|uniref:Zinc finger protein 2 n=1 Tax=Grosmannia clavigera (strain kw1407 / UAMH 11150) TaxID=655863 RepID=F0XKH7_GROCL|nr:zinc finger protein 2 [Grosmannia clavigera kw1407]EFX01632.1 zinc finger protein 2 [Grosmannia clavigera kw1407]
MSPTPPDRLLARSISHGGIAGAVVGPVVGVFLLLLALPFILRALRNARQGPSDAPHMDMIGPPAVEPGPAGQSPFAYTQSFPPTGSPTYDNNSFDDGKAPVSYSPSTAASGSAAGNSAGAAPPLGSSVANTNVPPLAADQPSVFPTAPYPPPNPLDQRSPTERSTSSSLTQTLTSFFRNNTQSTQVSASRGPGDMSRSPVEDGFGGYNPDNGQMWTGGPSGPMNFQQMPPVGYPQAGYPGPGYPAPVYPPGNYSNAPYPGYPGPGYPVGGYPGPGYPGAGYPQDGYPAEQYPGAVTGMYGAEEQHLTGASAEYYSGAPLSPPSDAGSVAERARDSPPPSDHALSSLISLSAAAAAAALVPSGLKDPKLQAIRTDSRPSGADFSPLSPTSPPEVSDTADTSQSPAIGAGAGEGEREKTVARSSPPPQASKAALTPEPMPEYTPLSPFNRPLVPSPRLPAPGTVNPRDVWAPATEDERFVHVTAELDRYEQSPPPLVLSAEESAASYAAAEQQALSPQLTVTPPDAKVSSPADGVSEYEDEVEQEEVENIKMEAQYDDGNGGFSMANLEAHTASQGNYLNAGVLSPGEVKTDPFYMAQQANDAVSLGPDGSHLMAAGSYMPTTSAPLQHTPSGMVLNMQATMATMASSSTSPGESYLYTHFSTPLAVVQADFNSTSPLSNSGSTPGQVSASPHAFKCEECGRMFDQVHKLNHHKRYHERPHECVVTGCGKRFGTKTHLDRHINDKHSKSRKYHCTEEGCPYSVPGGKSFPRKDNWRRHMVNKHSVQPDHDPIEVVDQPMMGV